MLDIRILRDEPDRVRADLRKRGRDEGVVDQVREQDRVWREGLKRMEALRAERNRAGKEVAEAKKAGRDASAVLARMQEVGEELARLESEVPAAERERDRLLRGIPNLMHPDVPVGKDDSENVELRAWGGKPTHAFPAVSHVDLLSSLDVADLERAARASGSRFFYLKNDLVLLGRALELFALRELAAKGFTAVEPPYMLRREALEGAIDLADFESVIYRVEAGAGAARGEAAELFLIATSEHPIAAMHMGEILESADLPLRYAGVSPCFRKEAGAHGKDTKGIFRVHQFSKVEQFVFCEPKDSWQVHEELVRNAEELYRKLGIPHRVVDICTGDLGSIAARKYDIEAWMPVQGAYREVVSCSNCTDFQARRYNTRSRANPGDPTEVVHTLNSTAVAVQRTLVAILENFQQEDGSVVVPEVLRPFAGVERIRPQAARTAVAA
ncbi:MAG TPA: serine--tRNA ligase [Candidatus Thermoplasmatota archaeon]|nr:serine--tRNA ligase [Candidatus Thermoplasmatota archaeon]